MELAVALRSPGVLVRVVPSPAAHEIAAVRAPRRTVAVAARRARGPLQGVRLAVVRGLVQEHQVPGPRFPVRSLGPASPEEEWPVALRGRGAVFGGPEVGEHPFGTVVPAHEVVPCFAERRESVPAGFHGARPGYSVALALGFNCVQDCL